MNSLRRLRVRHRLLLPALFLSVLAALVPRVRAGASAADASAIMRGVYEQDTSRDCTFRADFQVFDQDGRSTRKQFLYRRLGSRGDASILVVFTGPSDVRGVALLSISQPGGGVRQYLYTPAIRRAREVPPQERSAPFIGSDFSYEDISQHPLGDFAYRIISDTETMEGHKVYKLEATPVDPGRSQYKFLYYWVAQDVPLILHMEMYDAQGKQIRAWHAGGLRRVDGIWGARRQEMVSVLANTRTVLTIDEVKFNTGLDEKLFTPQSLESAP